MNYMVELEGGDKWEVSFDPSELSSILVGGVSRDVQVEQRPDGSIVAVIDGQPHVMRLFFEDGCLVVETQDGRRRKARVEDSRVHAWRVKAGEKVVDVASTGLATLKAPIAGSIASFLVADGAVVERGAPVLVIDAMKMLNSIAAPSAGIVHFDVKAGQTVRAGDLLARVEPKEVGA